VRTELSYDDVAAFLADRHENPSDLEPLTGGFWSSAWAYRADGDELVIRFGQERTWYEADQMAMEFTQPDLPVPEVKEIGTTPPGLAYAISTRRHGSFLEDAPVENADATAGTLTRLLVALFRTPAPDDAPVMWHPAGEPIGSWREFVLAGLVDQPGTPAHGWSSALAADRRLAALSAAVTERIHTLVDACPERRDLIHGDLLHGNVLISEDSRRVEAVLSWKCSVRGDFLFDAAWCHFWAPFHPGIAAALPKLRLLKEHSVRADPGATVDAAARRHCYELQIGFTHLGWNIWTGIQDALTATADRLAEVLDRGPAEA
jgi:aminoglycoside phosphotransferase (APT) family kinase protein